MTTPPGDEYRPDLRKQSSDYSTPAGYGPPQSFGAFGHGPAYPPPPGAPPYGAARPPGYGGAGYGPPAAGQPSSNIGWAIAAIFTFWPLAIPAFIFSSKVENQWFAGDVLGAQSSSRSARNFGLAAVIIGGVFLLLAIAFFIIAIAFVGTAVSHLPTYTPAPYTPSP